MSKQQGVQNSNQTREQIEKHDKRNDVELGSEYQIGNTSSQSQKKADVKQIKNNLVFEVIFLIYRIIPSTSLI